MNGGAPGERPWPVGPFVFWARPDQPKHSPLTAYPWPRGPFQIAARAVMLGFGPFVIKSRHHLTPEFFSLFFSQKKTQSFLFLLIFQK